MTHGALLVLLSAGALAVALGAHCAFWTRRLRAPSTEDELLHAETQDGWRLALGHHRPRAPRRGAPVLLVHGLAANRGAVDFGLAHWSLAAHLARHGFDCYALDLRGHGASRRARPDAPRSWNFDDYVRRDIPAAVAAIRASTGAPAVSLVGHSQGGLIGMAACALFPGEVASLVALGAPAWFRAATSRWLLRNLFFVFMGRLNRFAARCVAPFAGYWHPPVSEVAINGRNVERPVLRRVLANVVENVSTGVLAQFSRWVQGDLFDADDGRDDYRALLSSCRQPALFVSAAADRLAPPAVVERAAQAWGGPATLLRVGLRDSACCDYGHSDLLFGRNAPGEVFEPVCRWLDDQARGSTPYVG